MPLDGRAEGDRIMSYPVARITGTTRYEVH